MHGVAAHLAHAADSRLARAHIADGRLAGARPLRYQAIALAAERHHSAEAFHEPARNSMDAVLVTSVRRSAL